ncbi:arsenate reductase ArsC [Marinicella marina]|uniref:arsenate reductase ArsC n=2 Tax=Marinicella marina TaxID=2996016 RepID=UPI002260D843|nr:arsenate reductase ArsC [Marinicella marina]MDJ1139115.1 arsenate reductase ArsC [Marinicella marina]
MMKKNILFLCTGNSCRSQMAEGWLRHLKGDVFNVFSAGIETHGLNPHAVKVMNEAGVDISGQKSQLLSEFDDQPLDYVITVCGHAHESCPVFIGDVKVIHVGFDDPPKMALAFDDEESQMDCYRKVRDEIRDFVARIESKLDNV